MDLFVYGTLMDDGLVVELTGRSFRKEQAQLPGYRKVTPDGDYPYIVPDAAETVAGVVLRDVDDDALRAFDVYEDERLYLRREVTVTVAGNRQTCIAYVRRL
jgi:gamma-glutamylcyclotransferase (GGCT)/AIG2-like uncharacterized protein YtfP